MAIDVGYDRRHYAVSLLVCRANERKPRFWLDSIVEHKADSKSETINDVQLKDTIIKLLRKVADNTKPALSSLLVVRDGRRSGKELDAVEAAREELVAAGILASGIIVHVIDFHKQSLKGIRLWEVDQRIARNVAGGTAVTIGKRLAVLANTGSETLRQGTAEPVVVRLRSENARLEEVIEDLHYSSQMNWSSPRVAQRLPIELKRTDEQLESRSAQEIRRLR